MKSDKSTHQTPKNSLQSKITYRDKTTTLNNQRVEKLLKLKTDLNKKLDELILSNQSVDISFKITDKRGLNYLRDQLIE